MTTTTTKKEIPTRKPPRSGETAEGRRLVIGLWILATIALIATAVAVGYATGVIGEDATEVAPPVVDPADEAPTDDPADDGAAEDPADEDPANEGPADEGPADEVPAPTVRYDEEPRANWDVTGVAADDVLNVRDAPGVEGAIIETLPHDAAELESTGRIAHVGDALWREVVVPGDGVGWVSASYLTETS